RDQESTTRSRAPPTSTQTTRSAATGTAASITCSRHSKGRTDDPSTPGKYSAGTIFRPAGRVHERRAVVLLVARQVAVAADARERGPAHRHDLEFAQLGLRREPDALDVLLVPADPSRQMRTRGHLAVAEEQTVAAP